MRPVDDCAPAAGAGAAGRGRRPGFEEARKAWEQSWLGRMGNEAGPPLRSWESSILGRHADVEPPADGVDPESSAALLDRLIRGGMPGSIGTPRRSARAGRRRGRRRADEPAAPAQRRRQLPRRVRRLPRDTGSARTRRQPDGFAATTRPGVPLGSGDAAASTGLSGLMAANLIRAHRDELLQASRGKLDHMVIEVVEQPVRPDPLRRARAAADGAPDRPAAAAGAARRAQRHAASSRRGAIRCAASSTASPRWPAPSATSRAARARSCSSASARWSRRSSTATSTSSSSTTPSCSSWSASSPSRPTPRSSSAAPPRRCEARSSECASSSASASACSAALEPLALPAYLKVFLAEVWSQALVTGAARDGAERRSRRALSPRGVDLVDEHPAEALARAAQPVPRHAAAADGRAERRHEADRAGRSGARRVLRQARLPHHAGSLKGAPGSDLDHNMMVRHLEAAFRTPMPSADEAAPRTAAPSRRRRRSSSSISRADEERAIGLVSESAVDWSQHGRRAGEAAEPARGRAGRSGSAPRPTRRCRRDCRLRRPMPLADAAAQQPARRHRLPTIEEPPSRPSSRPAPQLRDHLELGFSYQLNLKDQWEKVRLTYMSPAAPCSCSRTARRTARRSR